MIRGEDCYFFATKIIQVKLGNNIEREKKIIILLFKKVAVFSSSNKKSEEKGKIVFLEPQKGENCYFFGEMTATFLDKIATFLENRYFFEN